MTNCERGANRRRSARVPSEQGSQTWPMQGLARGRLNTVSSKSMKLLFGQRPGALFFLSKCSIRCSDRFQYYNYDRASTGIMHGIASYTHRACVCSYARAHACKPIACMLVMNPSYKWHYIDVKRARVCIVQCDQNINHWTH